MIEIDINKYAPCITVPKIAKEVYQSIIDANPIDNEVTIHMNDIITISCQCINIIFGDLYMYLGADKFHENILLEGCSEHLGDFMAFMIKERIKNEQK